MGGSGKCGSVWGGGSLFSQGSIKSCLGLGRGGEKLKVVAGVNWVKNAHYVWVGGRGGRCQEPCLVSDYLIQRRRRLLPKKCQ